MKAPRIIIAGTGSNVGKTTVTLALLAAFTARGRIVQSFKAGPDFIDPGHHQAVTGRPSRNLDGWMLGREVNRAIFTRAATGVDFSIVEGMMGLFDGSSPVSELGSTAELAKQLEAPVLLVIDGSAASSPARWRRRRRSCCWMNRPRFWICRIRSTSARSCAGCRIGRG